ncbi:MAG: purine-nucleoside phosphorylase [bacterium]
MDIVSQAELDRRVEESVASIREYSTIEPSAAVILGTGTGDFTAEIKNAVEIPYQVIPHFASTTVEGHPGVLVMGEFSGRQVSVFAGRFHYYEGLRMHEVAYPVRVARALGAEVLVQFNAAGGIKRDLQVGDLLVVDDYVNMMGDSPLRGIMTEPPSAKFVPMNRPFDERLSEAAFRGALRGGLRVHRGTYIAVHGPSYETDAELYFFHVIGGAAVGMSTVPEAIVARSLGMRNVAISVITNLTFGVEGQHLSHKEVLSIARGALPKLKDILACILAET